MNTILIKGGTVAATGKPTDILVQDGVIRKMAKSIKSDDAEVIDANGHMLFPGLIDCHVHFREPGFEAKATMQSEAVAARAGGIACVCDMPNTDPPTVTVAALADKVRRAADVRSCDIRFFFGVTRDAHLTTLKDLWSSSSEELVRLRKRCAGVKLYLDHSTGNQKVAEELLGEIFETCANLSIPIIAHCEDPEINNTAKAANMSDDISAHSVVRPVKSEVRAIENAVELVRTYGAAFHVAHLSSAEGLEVVKKAKSEKLPVTCEVAPHHLLLNVHDYERLGTLCKMNPPVRNPEDNAALVAGVKNGDIDCIATDHAPHTSEEKREGAPLQAPSGVPGVETALPIALTLFAPDVIYRTMYENPNAIFRLDRGDLKEGSTTEIVIVKPDVPGEIHANNLHYKCGWTPFEGMKTKGAILRVI